MFNSDLPADNSKIRYSAGYIRDNFKALEAALGPGLTVFPTGTRLWFYQDTAPTGWNIVATLTDSLLAVKSNDNMGPYATGGTVGGTWQLPNHTLTIDEMPSHHHDAQQYERNFTNPRGYVPHYDENLFYTVKQFCSDTGGNQAHNHGNTWRPMSAVGIIAERS